MAETLLGQKPYDFVPLVENCEKSESKGHNKFHKETYSGKLILRIKTLTPIHIGSGVLGMNDNKTAVANRTMRRNENVIIPGSSIKGVARSIAEAASHSCAPNLPRLKGNIREDVRTAEDRFKKALPFNNNQQCSNSGSLCPACSMFGMSLGKESYRGKISFGEFKMEEGKLEYLTIPDLQSPFKTYPNPTDIFPHGVNNYGNERLYYCMACDGRDKGECYNCHKMDYYRKREIRGVKRPVKLRGRKFYFHNISVQETGNVNKTSTYEVISKGASFIGSINFENLTKEELGILAFSIGLDGSFNPKIGYAKPAFYGSIEFELLDTKDLISEYKKKDNCMDNDFIITLAKEYYTIADDEVKRAIDKLREILDKNKNARMWPVVNGNKVY